MALKPKKKVAEEIEEEIKENMQKEEPAEEDSKEETKEKESSDPQMVGYPVFPTKEDINRMIYENNQMLKLIVEYIQKEE